MHGFDEFFGNLYHLNAEEEPENPDYPKNPEFKARFGPRGVLKCKASDRDDPTEDPRFGRVGKQTIEDTGPLTRKRMETVDEEFLAAQLDFIDRQHRAGRPFFCWFNATRMHIYTHLKPESKGKTGLGIVADGMTEFDGMVGQLLKKLDDLGIADNTIVVWTTDNGAEVFSWPDGGTTPFKGEKNTNWEGGYRVPCAMRWPGVIKPGTEINHITSHEDFVPTLVAAAGEPNVTEKLLTGYQAAGKTFKVHLDGYDQRDLLAGTGPGKRQGILLLDRRRQPRRPAVRPLEARLHGAARRGSQRVGEPVNPAALPEAVRPSRRPVRAGAGGRRRLCQMARRARLPARPGAGLRGPALENLRRVSATPEARHLRARPGAGEAAGGRSRPALDSANGHSSRRQERHRNVCCGANRARQLRNGRRGSL